MSEKMLQVFDKTRADVAEVIAASLTVSESCFLSGYTEQFRIQFENNLNNCD